MNKFLIGFLGFLVILLALLIVVLVIVVIDQAGTKDTFYQNVSVVDKRFYTTTILIPVGKVMVPEIQSHWKLLFNVNGKVLGGDVSASCYDKVAVGDKMNINVRYGRYSTGVYPICP